MKRKAFVALAVAAGTIVASLGIIATPLAATAVVPTNDDFANAFELPSLPFSGDFDTTEATWSPSDPDTCLNSSTVWFVFTADKDMTVRVTGAGSSYEPSILVLAGPSDSMSVVSCTVQAAQQPVTFEATSGTTYRLMVASCCFYGSNTGGALHLSVSEVPPPPNDDFADAAVIDSLPYAPLPVDTASATTEETDPTYCSTNKSVWYEFTPVEDVNVAVLTGGYEASVSVWTGAPGALTPLDCKGGSYGAQFLLTGGVRYWIMISATELTPNAGGLLSLTIDETNEVLGVKVDPTVTVTSTGIATASGSVTCSTSGVIYVAVLLSQTFVRPPGTVTAYTSVDVECDGVAAWSVQLTSYPVGFTKGDATVEVTAVSADTGTLLQQSQQVKLKKK